MLKRGLSLLLACLLTLSMAACRDSAPETVPTTAPSVTAAATTAPTLSPEELLIASLPEQVKNAYDLGLVELSLLEDLDRVCLGKEAAQIVQAIHVLHHDAESQILNQLLESDHADIPVTRYWLAQTLFAAEAETIKTLPSQDYLENLDFLLKLGNNGSNPDSDLWEYFLAEGYQVMSNDVPPMVNPELPAQTLQGLSVATVADLEELSDTQLGQLYIDSTPDPTFPLFVVTAFDRLTGEKLMSGSYYEPFLPREKMTVQEVVETALRYHNWIPEAAVMLPHDEIPTYDTTIITDALLTRQTTLPEASCQNLPASWRGIASPVYTPDSNDALTDSVLQENEIQVIADAGFNFLQLQLNFRYFSSDRRSFWPGWMTDPDEKQMNETRLKEIDQVIAWCMERDIHVNLVCTDPVPGWPPFPPIFGQPHYARFLANQWQVLARRYADIPNTYLSFTMYLEPDIWVKGQYGKFFTPVVKAIREVSPDRCIIADMSVRGDPGESMAALGVALSTRAIWPQDFHEDYIYPSFEGVMWPYEVKGEICNAEAAMTNKRWNLDSPDEVAAVAAEYGVGFMVSSWAPISSNVRVLPERYSDEFMESYLNDFAAVLSQRGYGWCYGSYSTYVGLFSATPAVESTTYTQVGTAPLYIDDEMFAWFQSINQAA